jgi:hypothetical protein
MKYKIVYDGHIEEQVDFACLDPEIAVRAYSEAKVDAIGYTKAAVYAMPIAVIEKKPAKKKKVEKSTLFDGYSVTKSGCCGGDCSSSHSHTLSPEKDAFICEDSTWIDSVEWENGVGMTVHFLSGSARAFNVTYHAFKTYKEYVAAGGSAGGYYNANFKRLDK